MVCEWYLPLLFQGLRAFWSASGHLNAAAGWGAWPEVSQQWFVNDIYPRCSRVLRVYWSACGRLNAVAGWWAWTEVGQLFLNTVVCEWFFTLVNWCYVLSYVGLLWTSVITNGTIKLFLALMNWFNVLSQVSLLWTFVITNGTLEWFLAFMNWCNVLS